MSKRKIFFNLILLAAFAVFVLAPLLAFVIRLPNALLSLQLTEEIIARRCGLLAKSILLSASAAFMSMTGGLICALFLWKRNNAFFSSIKKIMLLFILIPPFIHAQAWIFFMDRLNRALDFSGLPASLWVEFMCYLPLVCGLGLLGLEYVRADSVEAAMLDCGDNDVLWRIAVPHAIPSVLAGGSLVFLLSMADYSIPSVFRYNVYALEIFAGFSATSNADAAFAASLPVLAVTVFVAVSYLAWFKEITLEASHRSQLNRKPKAALPLEVILGICGAALMLMQIGVPVFNLIREALSANTALMILKNAIPEIINTLVISMASAALSLIPGYAAAMWMHSGSKPGHAVWLTLCVLLAVPSSLTGVGLIFFWSNIWAGGLYGTAAMLVLAAVSRFSPIAAILMYVQIKSLDYELFDVARIYAGRQVDTLKKVYLPLLLPVFSATFLIIFALASGELGATLMVVPAGMGTLTMKIYNYLHFGAADTVAVLCLAQMTIAVFAGIAGAWILKKCFNGRSETV
ncbi:MAG: ABC transporter permease subunit [Clostridia bacterium]|nr:ABC transporter permease subunit [Clostridia bacterium]